MAGPPCVSAFLVPAVLPNGNGIADRRLCMHQPAFGPIPDTIDRSKGPSRFLQSAPSLEWENRLRLGPKMVRPARHGLG